jgi:macrolide transport system ATP-binding/permease protein
MPAFKESRAGELRARARHAFLRMNLSHVLVVSQIAISLLMLVAAGLFVRTLSNLHSVQLGFNRENVLLFQLNAPQVGHHEPEIAASATRVFRMLLSLAPAGDCRSASPAFQPTAHAS